MSKVNLSKIQKGDIVLFKCGGTAEVLTISEKDCDDWQNVKFTGMDDGTWYEQDGSHVDGIDVINIVGASSPEGTIRTPMETIGNDDVPF